MLFQACAWAIDRTAQLCFFIATCMQQQQLLLLLLLCRAAYQCVLTACSCLSRVIPESRPDLELPARP